MKELERVEELQEITGGTRSTDNSKPSGGDEGYKAPEDNTPETGNRVVDAVIKAVVVGTGGSLKCSW